MYIYIYIYIYIYDHFFLFLGVPQNGGELPRALQRRKRNGTTRQAPPLRGVLFPPRDSWIHVNAI